jgi:hypothetical protein
LGASSAQALAPKSMHVMMQSTPILLRPLDKTVFVFSLTSNKLIVLMIVFPLLDN